MRIIKVEDRGKIKEQMDELLKRSESDQSDIEKTVKDIIDNIKKRGDEALLEYTEKFDGVELSDIKVTKEEVTAAREAVGEEFLEILEEAAANIKEYHECELEETWMKEFRPGVRLGQKITPIGRVGIYVPGGKAGYPSTVLMDSIPAVVAGVESIAMVTPPLKDGRVDPYILAAASVAGVDEIYKVGGAQSVAALAYGTETIAPVNKIVGPGNIYVATAKKQVFGKVAIDMIAGPSEIGILADENAKKEIIAADLLSQAEHDEMAASILVTTSSKFAEEVKEEVYRQIELLPRQEIMTKSIDNYGTIFVANTKEEAVDIMNEVAPEHLEILFEDAESFVDSIKNAGAIFIGQYTPEPVGDYFAGPNHTLPTSGTAKFSSPLGTYDFFKRSSLLCYEKDALERIAEKVQSFAEKEGLFAHSNAVKKRFE
ncbi:histidinol dehydrogenase [Gallicola sp. Sow4_E12]|uniref:histidinol dehydrogenase n=1 Tax=Gallicola sp. Sow4_E12 TaxID=3438785 RepID=UPI003F93084B